MFRLHPYCLALVKPLPLPGGGVLRERKGVLLENPEMGGWGDAAPLPGFSRESLEQVLDALTAGDVDAPELPSLRFAVECASRPFALPALPVAVNALWIPASESVCDFCRRIGNWINPVVKIKPGKTPDLQAMRDFCSARPDARLRIDGNRQWSIAETLRVFESLPGNVLDYFEEPLSDPDGYAQIRRRVDLPLALDESLLTGGGDGAFSLPGIKALVLKPTLLGNREDRAPLLAMAVSQGWSLTWSSCFESGIGLWQLAALAKEDGHAGLDTAAIFTHDLIRPRPLSLNGQIIPNQQSWRVNV
jgi:o-succinylbenzoate synthase